MRFNLTGVIALRPAPNGGLVVQEGGALYHAKKVFSRVENHAGIVLVDLFFQPAMSRKRSDHKTSIAFIPKLLLP
jgi:hypothetical protein